VSTVERVRMCFSRSTRRRALLGLGGVVPSASAGEASTAPKHRLPGGDRDARASQWVSAGRRRPGVKSVSRGRRCRSDVNVGVGVVRDAAVGRVSHGQVRCRAEGGPASAKTRRRSGEYCDPRPSQDASSPSRQRTHEPDDGLDQARCSIGRKRRWSARIGALARSAAAISVPRPRAASCGGSGTSRTWAGPGVAGSPSADATAGLARPDGRVAGDVPRPPRRVDARARREQQATARTCEPRFRAREAAGIQPDSSGSSRGRPAAGARGRTRACGQRSLSRRWRRALPARL